MNFSFEDKVLALTRAGYEIKEDKIIVLERRTGGPDNEVLHAVWNVYLGGQSMCPWGAAGTYRVDWVFNRELEKRLLKLF